MRVPNAAAVQIGKVEARAGSGAVIRGLTIGAGGLSLDDDVVGARVDSVRVSATTGNGVTLGARCAVTIVSSAIERAGWGQRR